jgi:hypothetical protein
MPRAFNAAAIPRIEVMPAAWISRTIERVSGGREAIGNAEALDLVSGPPLVFK